MNTQKRFSWLLFAAIALFFVTASGFACGPLSATAAPDLLPTTQPAPDRVAAPQALSPAQTNPLIDTEITPLSNPSFEQGLLGWLDEGAPGFAVENIASHGAKSISLTPTDEQDQLLMRDFELQVGKKYYVSAKVKTEGEIEGAIGVVYGASGQPESAWLRPDTDWTEVGVTFTGTTNTQDEYPNPNPNTAYVQLRLQAETLGRGSTGKVYFDDIRVYELIDYSTYLRVKLNAPQDTLFGLSLQALSAPTYSSVSADYFAETGLQTGQFSDWIDLGAMKHPDPDGDGADWGYGGFDGGSTTFTGLHFIDMTGGQDYFEYKKLPQIDATVQFAYAPDESAILADFHEQTPGGVVGYYVPQTEMIPPAYVTGFEAVADNIQARNEYIHALDLPDVHLDKFYLEGYLNGYDEFYSDPSLAEKEVDTIAEIGFSALDTRYSGLATPYREAAATHGITQTHNTFRFWDAPEYYFGYEEGQFLDLDWEQIRSDINQAYDEFIQEMTTEDPAQIPPIQFINIGDEISGMRFAGPQYNARYRQYLQQHNVTPQMLGKTTWDEVVPFANLDWWLIGSQRPANDADITLRRSFYWTARFWNHVAAKGHAIETEVIAEKLPGRSSTLNFGPPWSTDYTSYLRGAELFEFARQKGVSMMFNEDWLNTYGWRHAGIQLNAYLIDLSRSAAAVNNLEVGSHVILGGKETIQLKLASAIGKGAKYIDLYRYGPQFAADVSTHWSDATDMVEGVAHFTRLLDKAEDVLQPGKVRL